MTVLDYIPPMRAKTIHFIVYPGFELLDLSGPMSVFATANALVQKPLYRLNTLCSRPGLVTSGAGLTVSANPLNEASVDSNTTILVVGADASPLLQAVTNTTLLDWLGLHAAKAERFGSICSGTFVLQAAGLLHEKVVTTHWAGCDPLRQQDESLRVLDDALYHIDGKCWTSAGVTTGIDMALEMLKRDHGRDMMQSVAKRLVVYAQRPGKQSQFAQIQNVKTHEDEGFASLINWLKEQIGRPVKVSEMADFVCMSERSFQRKFSASYSTSPSRFFERMRMEYARDFLLPQLPVEVSARSLGYNSVAAFRTSFEKHFGISPSTSKQVR